eukprot:30033-Rhodomonas_salina.6
MSVPASHSTRISKQRSVPDTHSPESELGMRVGLFRTSSFHPSRRPTAIPSVSASKLDDRPSGMEEYLDDVAGVG